MDRRGFMQVIAAAMASPHVPIALPTTGPNVVAAIKATENGLYCRYLGDMEWECVVQFAYADVPYEADE